MQPVQNDQLNLFVLTGEALCKLQILEDALSHSIALKKDVKIPFSLTKKEGDNFVAQYRKLTLGQAIKMVKEKKLYTNTLINDLHDFLVERNWFIHRFLPEHLDDQNIILRKDSLFKRIKAVGEEATRLQKVIEVDMIAFSERQGLSIKLLNQYKWKVSS